VTPVTADNLTRHELIGLDAKISGASNNNQNRIKGLIIAETRNTLTICHDRKEITVARMARPSFSTLAIPRLR
jgi:RNase P/RNase MRP subunit p29